MNTQIHDRLIKRFNPQVWHNYNEIVKNHAERRVMQDLTASGRVVEGRDEMNKTLLKLKQ